MKMPDDLDAPILLSFAIAVMEFEPVRDEEIAQAVTFDLRVVIAGDENYVALFSEPRDQREEFVRPGFIMNKIAQQD